MEPLTTSAAEPAHPADREESVLGIRRFFHNNETLIKVGSLLFAAAGVLRAQPEDYAVAMLQSLLTVMALVVFLRILGDLPRRYGVLPGQGWTFSLIVVYYCMIISLIVAVLYLSSNFLEQRYQYLSIALGTLLAVAGTSGLTHWLTTGDRTPGPLGRLMRGPPPEGLAGLVVLGVLVIIVVGAYALAYALGPAINAALDRVFGPPPVIGRPRG
jgi:hypothetical protein